MTKVPKNWRLLALSDCATIERGRFSHRPRNAPEFYGGCIPFVQTGDVSNSGGVITAYSQTLNERGLSISKLFPKGTLLMTIAANIGDVAELGFDSACPDSLVAILPKDGLNSGYLRRYLEFLKARIHYLAPQNAQKNISVEFLEPLPVLLPPLPEQQKIAAILGAWDRAIEKLQTLVKAKTERLGALRQQILTGTRRFPKFNEHSWVTKRVGDLLKSVNHYEKWDDRRTFKLAGVRRNSGGVFFRDELLGAEIKVKVCKKIHSGDFLISRRQITWGGMSIVPPEFHGYDVNDEYEVLTVRDPAAFDMRFFHYLSQTARLKNLAYLASNGVFAERLRLNFDLDAFLHQPIRVPSLKEEQLKIVAVLDSCVREIRLLEAELDALKQQKRGLMQKILTGTIRVKP